ncbi:MAG TPA: MBL fold metallo-hydrolase [Aggregatilineales bacterium]|nr:MBL fold metallo-hydrolase [Anaerolineales bacterium]HRE47923.1 MBL fold metallo-hydrolase [Aggregatilineales bacterium]
MKITFHGAAHEVTGSKHLIEVNGRRILLDCGLFQGKRSEAFDKNRKLPFDAAQIDVMVLSHAHTDHAGNIPMLVKNGFRGDIFCTGATQDLCGAMLLDSAHIQESDVKFTNKIRTREGLPPFKPLYTQEDAVKALKYLRSVGYERTVEILPGIALTFRDAGHMLGSAITSLTIEDREAGKDIQLVFSGDIGSPGAPILRDPSTIDEADVLIMESTYGDKDHESYDDAKAILQDVIGRTYARGGKVIIPSFAVGRAQELVYTLHQLTLEQKIPPMEIYVDSPLAVNVTGVFSNHPECYDEEIREFISGSAASRDPFGFRGLKYTRSADDSKALNGIDRPIVIISASGMAESGRILHHLRNNIEQKRNTILLVGFQAEHTLGRKLENHESPVSIFGEKFDVRAEIVRISGFSAHAGRTDLLNWAGAIKKKPRRTFLVHGEEKPLLSLKQGLTAEVGLEHIDLPTFGQSFTL